MVDPRPGRPTAFSSTGEAVGVDSWRCLGVGTGAISLPLLLTWMWTLVEKPP